MALYQEDVPDEVAGYNREVEEAPEHRAVRRFVLVCRALQYSRGGAKGAVPKGWHHGNPQRQPPASPKFK